MAELDQYQLNSDLPSQHPLTDCLGKRQNWSSSREQALDEAVRNLREQDTQNGTNGDQAMAHDEWLAEYDDWIKSHESRNPHMDDSREHIYSDGS